MSRKLSFSRVDGWIDGCYSWRAKGRAMAVQWHPLLARFLRHDYADRLEVQTEVPLGELPLRADFLLIRRAPELPLPFPLSHLGSTTLMEYKGPDETVSQKDLQLLGIYADLYVYREDLPARRDLTLWLVGSRFADRLSDSDRATWPSRPRWAPALKAACWTATQHAW
ncbi:MAG: hypothetical protein COZ06_16375 [Armatimonadetes bacterium CG_4_10_14_3_um_filter_66_18]|nr:MAG: hypothetical protein COZ06_16375 [Armatimonadetes bacterium CG_4_10_14_3_um_filter_66_18]